ncbi:MAG: inosine/xanthosine triphosphatase [Candidatus Micrarchaeota archaeon]|nr:inosine/xanthosine triphosphatase [Candidatus Micrarchaeota archaeon]
MAYGHCIVGGTFTCIHEGHVNLLSECNMFSRITIGLTSDRFVRAHKIYPSFPYEKRLANLQRNLAHNGMLSRATIVKIESERDVADRLEADAIVVSEETEGAARKINAARKKRGLIALEIISVPLAYAGNLKKISCEGIYNGKYDERGRLLKPVRVQAGTDNPTKLSGARIALARVFGRRNVMLFGHKEDSKVSHHPFNSETFAGAANRAHAAWRRAGGKCDYSLGIESGLFSLARGIHMDITVCCVYDGQRETYGTGMGFAVPEWIAKKIRAHGSDLSRVMAEVAGVEGIGRKQGALGWFSDGKMHRRDQIEAAVKCAFVPRIAEARKGIHY